MSNEERERRVVVGIQRSAMDSTEAESTTLPSASHLSTTIMTDPSLPSSLPDLPDERNPRFSTPAASGLLADGAALLEAREVPSTYGGSIKAWWSYCEY